MESIIGPLVAAFAANCIEHNDEVVTYDHLIEDEQIAISMIHYASYEDFVFDKRSS